ncbi:MAG TPA: hypothetical protein P5048_00140 [Chlamydiales bacterium]|nr:hypothetical protein [Chlamydiales bacterium]
MIHHPGGVHNTPSNQPINPNQANNQASEEEFAAHQPFTGLQMTKTDEKMFWKTFQMQMSQACNKMIAKMKETDKEIKKRIEEEDS